MEQVSEFVVLKDVNYGEVLIVTWSTFNLVNDTDESVQVTVFLFVGDAEIEKGLSFFSQLGKLNEDVLLFPYL